MLTFFDMMKLCLRFLLLIEEGQIAYRPVSTLILTSTKFCSGITQARGTAREAGGGELDNDQKLKNSFC
jgi:hypothetical protein